MSTQTIPLLNRTPDPNPGYRGGSLIDVNIPTTEIVDGITVRGSKATKLLKNVNVIYVKDVMAMESDPNRLYCTARVRMSPGPRGTVFVTGFDDLAPSIAALEANKVYSFVGSLNYRNQSAFFQVEKIVITGAAKPQEAAPAPAPAAKPKAKKATKAAAPAPELAEPKEPTF